MKTKDLQKFCSVDETRPNIMHPFDVGDWTFATDGRIIIRVPKDPENNHPAPEKPVDPYAVGGFMLDGFYPHQEKLADLVIDPPRTVECWCVSEYLESLDGCDHCDGTGQREIPEKIQILRSIFDTRFILLAQSLPNATLYPSSDGLGTAFLTFDGGTGYIMPMRDRKSVYAANLVVHTA